MRPPPHMASGKCNRPGSAVSRDFGQAWPLLPYLLKWETILAQGVVVEIKCKVTDLIPAQCLEDSGPFHQFLVIPHQAHQRGERRLHKHKCAREETLRASGDGDQQGVSGMHGLAQVH